MCILTNVGPAAHIENLLDLHHIEMNYFILMKEANDRLFLYPYIRYKSHLSWDLTDRNFFGELLKDLISKFWIFITVQKYHQYIKLSCYKFKFTLKHWVDFDTNNMMYNSTVWLHMFWLRLLGYKCQMFCPYIVK